LTPLALGLNAYSRSFAKTPQIRLVNRYFEENPANRQEGSALLSRPGNAFGVTVGAGPIRATFQQPGFFGGDLFVVSGETLYRYARGGQPRAIRGEMAEGFTPKFAPQVGIGYQRLWVSDGQALRYYDGLRFGEATLTLTLGQSPQVITNNIRVRIGGIYYRFGAAGGAGTLASPYGVTVGANDSASLANLAAAIDQNGIAHPDVTVADLTSTTLRVRTRTVTEAPGATILAVTDVTTTNPVALLTWSGPALAFGSELLRQIATPDDVAIADVAASASHVVCVVANTQRCYFLRPGAVEIDPLDFFEAELEPDAIVQALNVGDQIWLIGESATEVWYPSGELDLPFSRVQGQAYSRGGVLGSAVRIDDRVVMVGDDGVVYELAGGLQRRSHAGIEELIRQARTDARS